MRAIHFMMIDYIKVKQQVYFMPLFLVIALLMWGQGYSILVPFSYMMFVRRRLLVPVRKGMQDFWYCFPPRSCTE